MITTMVRLAGAIVLLALGFTPALSLAVQTESPVDCDEGVIAEPVGFAYGDHTSSGCTIDSPTDLDRFEFCGTIGDEVKLNVLSLSPMDPTVEVRDSGFGLVSQGSCNHVCSFMLNFSLPMTDCYTVFVSDVGTDEPGAYTLQLERILPVPDTAVHMDYDKSESNPISDTISPGTDVDFYTFDATAGTDIRLNVLSLNPTDPVVEIRDPSGAVVVDGVADGATCNHVCSFSVDLLPAVSGTYSLIIYDNGIDESGGYQLSLWCLAGPCDGIPDPSGPLISYVTPVSDTISPGVDGDFYTFNATAGTDIRLNVSSLNPTDPVVEILDPSGAVVVNGVVDGATCTHVCSFSLDLSPAVSGTYSLLIYDNGIDESGGYQLSLWCLWGDCDSDADGLLDGDPRVSFNTPAVLPYGDPANDAINQAVDSDVFVFGGTAGDLIRLNVTSLNPTDPVVDIRDPNGTVVVNGVVDGASCIHVCSFSLDLPLSVSGTYSLIIYDNGIDETGGYEIGLQCLLGSCTDAAPVCSDNCIDMPNSRLIPDEGGFSQRDTDADGYGNLCDPDFDGNGVVDPFDFSQLKAVFGSASAPHEDLNGNGVVDPFDFSLLKHFFGGEPGPSSCDTGPPRP